MTAHRLPLLLVVLLSALALFITLAFAQNPPRGLEVVNQALQARALTKSDSVKIVATRGIFIGDASACNIAVIFVADSAAVTLTNVQSGAVLPFSINQLMSTNTTCATVFALY